MDAQKRLRMMRWLSLAFTLLGILFGQSRARADQPLSWSCDLVEENTVHIDGMKSDWEGVSPFVLKVNAESSAQARTLGVKLYCNYDQKNVYLLIDVEDDIVLRSKSATPREDHVELLFGVLEKKSGDLHIDRLLIFPSSSQQKQKRVVRWQAHKGASHLPKVLEGEGPAGGKSAGEDAFAIYDALQPRGYAIELRLPKKRIPGYQEGTPLRLSLRVVDSDAPSGELAASAELSPSEPPSALSVLELEEGQKSLAELLSELKLSADDIYLDKTADVGNGSGRVLMIGKYLAFAGKNYAYQEMAPQRADIKSAQLIELSSKQHAVALRIAERGGGGGREVLRIYVLPAGGGQFQSIFAAEVLKEQGTRRLSTQVHFERRGATAEIVLTPQAAVGFSAATYNELPAEDVISILLPWQDKRTRYVYKGQRYVKE